MQMIFKSQFWDETKLLENYENCSTYNRMQTHKFDLKNFGLQWYIMYKKIIRKAKNNRIWRGSGERRKWNLLNPVFSFGDVGEY